MSFIFTPADCVAVRQYLGAKQGDMAVILKLGKQTIWRACELGQGKTISVSEQKSQLFTERLVPLAQYRQDLIENITYKIADYGSHTIQLPFFDNVGAYQEVQPKKWREPPTLDEQSPEMAEWICTLIGRWHTYQAFCAEMYLKHGVRIVNSKDSSDDFPVVTREEITMIAQALGLSLTRLSSLLNVSSYMKPNLNQKQLQRIADFRALLPQAHADLKQHDNSMDTALSMFLCHSGKSDKRWEYDPYEISPQYFDLLARIERFDYGAELMTKLAALPVTKRQ